jgi:hypothetical protein
VRRFISATVIIIGDASKDVKHLFFHP